jgi:hypothetical protein
MIDRATVAAVARELGLSWDTVNTIAMDATRMIIAADTGRLDGVRVIGVDEHRWSHSTMSPGRPPGPKTRWTSANLAVRSQSITLLTGGLASTVPVPQRGSFAVPSRSSIIRVATHLGLAISRMVSTDSHRSRVLPGRPRRKPERGPLPGRGPPPAQSCPAARSAFRTVQRSCSAFARTMIAADPARGSSRETELSIKHPRQKR